MKIAIIHDYFDKRGGGERLVINLARALKADVYTGFIDRAKTFDVTGVKIISLGIGGFPSIRRKTNIAKAFEKFRLPKYDAYIFSGVWCISAAKNHHPNLLYLHTPMRAIYDLRDYHRENSNLVNRILLERFSRYWKPKDRAYMANFDVICPNSENVKRRVLRFYGKELHKRATVVYTGIESDKYKYIRDDGFYLSPQRLDPLKRIDMVITAFKNMPDRKLVITGTGPDENRLKKLANGCSNIVFLGSVDDKKMLELYGTCKATVAANLDEDLGMMAIEGHACGKPTVAIKEGAFPETVKEGVNGVFFKDASDIERAIAKLEKTKWNYKKIQKTAQRYDIAVFSKKIETILKKTAK